MGIVVGHEVYSRKSGFTDRKVVQNLGFPLTTNRLIDRESLS